MAASRGDHARILPGTLVNNRYEVGSEMGRGNFSVVYSAKDKMANNAIVALKFVKKEYAHDAKFEHDILKAIRDANPTGTEKVLMMIDHFGYNRHPCFVLAPKGCPLKARRFGLREGHVSRNELRALTKQMCEALSFLHFKMKLVHTDLKPENILLDNNMPSSVKGLGEGFTIVDFGSASFYRMDRLDSDLISTRPYRSPEVVLGNGWYFPADTWSLGCILYEVYTGHKLFDVSDDHVHLAQMATRLGALPKVFTHDSQNSRRFFDGAGQLSRPNVRAAPYMRPVAEELRDDKEFSDLILGMLAFEPSRRIRCDDALRHPFVTGADMPRSRAPSPTKDMAHHAARAPAAVPSAVPKVALSNVPVNTNGLTSARTAVPLTATTSSSYDKENTVRVAAVPTVKPLYNNIRLGALQQQQQQYPPTVPNTARVPASSSSGLYGHHYPAAPAAPLTSRTSLISPAAPTAVPTPHTSRSNTPNAYLTPSVAGSALMDDRLKRMKSDPSMMPVAGRSSGLQYAHRMW